MTLKSFVEKFVFLVKSPLTWMDKILLLACTIQVSLGSKIQGNKDRLISSSKIYSFKWNRIPLKLRPMDIGVFYDVFLNQAYALPKDWVLPEHPVIVDMGGHIGLVSRYYFQSFNEKATFHTLEPNPRNFEVLEQNLKHLVFRKYPIAISKNAGLRNFEIDMLGHNSKFSDKGIPVQTLTFNQFLIDHNINSVDLLKMDIEGAETQIFESISDWKHKVKHIILEYHYDDTEAIQRMLESKGLKVKIVK